jgi:tetratricopeptide (TPR) repeat protein
MDPVSKGTPAKHLALAQSFREEYLCAGLIFFVTLALYAWTRAPTITLIDSGELAVVAHSWGVAHPPGFPLWVVLAHFASLIPVGNVASRINLSSGCFGALASAIVTLIAIEVISALSSFAEDDRSRKKYADKAAPQNSVYVYLAAMSTGLLVATSRTLWSYATITEVYALNTALILLIIFLMLRWRRSMRIDPISIRSDLLLYLAAALFGLALGVHHVTVGLILPGLAVLVYRTEGMRFFRSRRFAYAAIISAANLVAIYTYLPIAASHAPLINWGNPVSVKAIWEHITGRQYQPFLTFEPALIGQQLMEFARMIGREFSWPWTPAALLLAAAGFQRTFRKQRTLFWFLFVLGAANIAYAISYGIAEDKDAYYLTTFVVIAVATGAGVIGLLDLVLSRRGQSLLVNAIAVGLLMLPPGLAIGANWRFDNRRHYWIASDYVGNIFRSAERRSLVLTFDWQVASPIFYAQRIEHRRTDVKIVDINLLRRSWYLDYLRRAYPDLIARSAGPVTDFGIELKHWEQDAAAYENDEARGRINSKFEAMIKSFVEEQTRAAAVYVTLDFLAPADQDRQLTTSIGRQYGMVPEGLLFKLTADRKTFQNPRRIRIETRGLNDGTLRFDNDDVVWTKVFPVYVTMLINRGRYFASFGRHAEAIDAFKEALALDPNLDVARRALEESSRQLPAK